MSIILVPEGEELDGLTRAEVLALEVPDYVAEEQYRDMLDEIYGPAKIAGLEYQTSRALEELDPIAYRCGFADYVSEYLTEVDPDDFPIEVLECSQCGGRGDDLEYGMCGGCLHDAERSGWTPGVEDGAA